jgi:hypothetical protein
VSRSIPDLLDKRRRSQRRRRRVRCCLFEVRKMSTCGLDRDVDVEIINVTVVS